MGPINPTPKEAFKIYDVNLPLKVFILACVTTPLLFRSLHFGELASYYMYIMLVASNEEFSKVSGVVVLRLDYQHGALDIKSQIKNRESK